MVKNNSSFFILVEADLSSDWQGQRSHFLEEVKGVSFLEYLLKRLNCFGLNEFLCLFVPERDENEDIHRLAQKLNLKFLKQSKDGLRKIISMMKEGNRKYLISLKAGSIFADGEIIEKVIYALEQEKCEYIFLSDFPMGVEVSGFSLSGMEKLLAYSEDGSFNVGIFKDKLISLPLVADKQSFGLGLNLSLNRKEDVKFARYIINSFDDDGFTLRDVINLIDKQREELAFLQKNNKSLADAKYYSKKLNMIEVNRQCSKLSSYPFLLQIETSTRCNLKCRMCQRERDDFTEPAKDMEMDIFNKLLPISPYISQSSLFGIGEPLLNKNFNKMFIELRKSLVDVLFYTNGMLIDEEMASLWVRKGLRDIIFSIDSTNPEKVENLRKGIKFEIVIEKIRMINKYKKLYKKRLPNIRISYTVMKSNLEELPDMVKLSKELRVGKIIVTFMVAFVEEFKEESLYYHQELTNEVFKRSIILGKEYGVDVQVPGFFHFLTKKEKVAENFAWNHGQHVMCFMMGR